LVDVGVQVDLALFLELHDGDPGEELGDGCEAEDGGRGVDGLFVLEIGVAVTLLQEELAVFHDEDGSAGDVRAFQLERDDAVEEGFEVGGYKFVGGRRIAGGRLVPRGAGLSVGFFCGSGLWKLRVRGGNEK
jgi:hypothetical protein